MGLGHQKRYRDTCTQLPGDLIHIQYPHNGEVVRVVVRAATTASKKTMKLDIHLESRASGNGKVAHPTAGWNVSTKETRSTKR